MTELEQVREALGDAAGDFALIMFDIEAKHPMGDALFRKSEALYRRLCAVRAILSDPLTRAKIALEHIGQAV